LENANIIENAYIFYDYNFSKIHKFISDFLNWIKTNITQFDNNIEGKKKCFTQYFILYQFYTFYIFRYNL